MFGVTTAHTGHVMKCLRHTPLHNSVRLSMACPGQPGTHAVSVASDTSHPGASTHALTPPCQLERGLAWVQHTAHTCIPGA